MLSIYVILIPVFVSNKIFVCEIKDESNLIAGTVDNCTTWTAWVNSDNPDGIETNAHGDREIAEKNWWQPIGIQGRIAKTQQTVTKQKIQIDLQGLKCLHEDQIDKKCLDYEVRFCLEGNIQQTLDLHSNTI